MFTAIGTLNDGIFVISYKTNHNLNYNRMVKKYTVRLIEKVQNLIISRLFYFQKTELNSVLYFSKFYFA